MNMTKEEAYNNYLIVKEKYSHLSKDEITPEIFMEMLSAAFQASKFDELVDLAKMELKWKLRKDLND